MKKSSSIPGTKLPGAKKVAAFSDKVGDRAKPAFKKMSKKA